MTDADERAAALIVKAISSVRPECGIVCEESGERPCDTTATGRFWLVEADLYARLGTTMEWDTAAGHAVLSAAGGRVACIDGGVLGYGKKGFVNPPFVAAGL